MFLWLCHVRILRFVAAYVFHPLVHCVVQSSHSYREEFTYGEHFIDFILFVTSERVAL